MKKFVVLFLFLFTYAAICQSNVKIEVTNPIPINRNSETIEINFEQIKKLLPGINSNNLAVFSKKDNSQIAHQLIDYDQDGIIDQLIFQSNFSPNESKSFVIKKKKSQRKEFTNLVATKFVKGREDFAWENDRIAFRIYGPAMAAEVDNGIDIWTKRVKYPIVEKWYAGEEKPESEKISYHVDHGEGADFFAVGKSLGCGGSALWKNEKLYQSGVFKTYKKIADGPLRAVFEVSYNYLVDGKEINEVKRITLDAGKNLNKIDVTFNTKANNSKIEFAAGLVKREATTKYSDENKHWLSLWGATTKNSADEFLGTGIIFPKSTFKTFTEDENHYLVIGVTKFNDAFTYYSGAGWTRSGDFKSVDDWNNYLTQCSQEINSPLRVSIKANNSK
ncbi:MAG: hypothetical protein AUJ54_05255 [Ignavibacteria bacterium CG1_02_37_35]|nr:MAG: hypothetical protein AUJ54_05255 [Ignavibacteria bacterium CG1_02_37_35]